MVPGILRVCHRQAAIKKKQCDEMVIDFYGAIVGLVIMVPWWCWKNTEEHFLIRGIAAV